VHSHVASLLVGARLELKELKAHSTLLGICITYLLLRSDLEAAVVEIKDRKHKLYPLHVKHVFLSRVIFSMLPKRTLNYSRRSLI
jgi:hypothetical protein